MSIFAVLTALSLFSGHTLAFTAPDCNSTWGWAYNSIGQSPCLVAAYLLSPCYGNATSLGPVGPGESYQGPSSGEIALNTCGCCTVVYSLLSACGACQGGSWITWFDYIPNCSIYYLDSEYLYIGHVPNGTSVPYWALINVTTLGTWDPNESRVVGDTPEAGPGATITIPASTPTMSSSLTATTHSPTATSSPSSKSSGSSSNVGVIAGSVVGGALAICAVAFIVFMRRQRKHQGGSPTAAMLDPIPHLHPLMDEFRPQSSDGGAFVPPPLLETRAPPMRLYDQDDPTTFPWNQETDPVPKADTQIPETSSAGDTLTNMATSPPPTYSGLPTV